MPAPLLRRIVFFALPLALAAAPAFGHLSGVDHMRLVLDRERVSGEWEIHLHDARLAIGLDPALAGEPGYVDLRRHEAALRETLLAHVRLGADGRVCSLAFGPRRLVWKPKNSTVQLDVTGGCDHAPRRVRLAYDLLFALDRKHRGYFSVEDARTTHVGVFKFDGDHVVEFDVHHFDPAYTLRVFVREGVQHILSGFDHVLFLVALLLPAALVRAGGDWRPRAGFWGTAREVTRIVTAFTAAHSLTLALAFFRLIVIPPHVVESSIALSVFAAAWNNLRPFLPGRAWLVALLFGLAHGLGFAGALADLALPRQAHALALASFNLGVELGQLAIVALALPLLFAASRLRAYPRAIMGVGSLAIAWMATLWFLDRAFGVSFLAR